MVNGYVDYFLILLILNNPFSSDSDLHMTALALELCCTLMADRRSSPNVGLAVRNKVFPQALTLIKSSLLQGQALLVCQSAFLELHFDLEYMLVQNLLCCNCRLCKAFLLH
jgi:cullin-associated NEDD8-dissociated protein 1